MHLHCLVEFTRKGCISGLYTLLFMYVYLRMCGCMYVYGTRWIMLTLVVLYLWKLITQTILIKKKPSISVLERSHRQIQHYMIKSGVFRFRKFEVKQINRTLKTLNFCLKHFFQMLCFWNLTILWLLEGLI